MHRLDRERHQADAVPGARPALVARRVRAEAVASGAAEGAAAQGGVCGAGEDDAVPADVVYDVHERGGEVSGGSQSVEGVCGLLQDLESSGCFVSVP